MRRFKKHRTYSIMLFYGCALTCLLTRALYFCFQVIKPNNIFSINLFLIVFPSYLGISTIACQLLTYILLILSLKNYFKERSSGSLAQIEDWQLDLQYRQKLASVGMTSYIIFIPLFFVVEYLIFDLKTDLTTAALFD